MADLNRVVEALETLYTIAHGRMRERFAAGGKPDGKKLNENQLPVHGLAYLRTEQIACREIAAWAQSDHERAIASAYVADVARRLRGGIDLGPCESVSLEELGVSAADRARTIEDPRVLGFVAEHGSAKAFVKLAQQSRDEGYGRFGLDEMNREIQSQFKRFVDAEVVPIAQDVHRRDVLIPMSLLDQMSELGVFGLTIPEAYGGLGMGKVAMCVVTEELSRGYIGVGSLGTRAEIAAELILGVEPRNRRNVGSLRSQKERSSRRRCSPNPIRAATSRTSPRRAERQDDGSYRITGNKTWITHAVRADLMTLLARTNPDESGYRGLSMLLAPKSRLDPAPGEDEFVDEGLSGTEIKVLGYRGMKEYELSFDGYRVPADGLLGGEEGAGFKQLMRTFESARIQTAARGVGVARAALEDGMLYASERRQFKRPIFEFPRVAAKLGKMIAMTQAARQLTYFAARRKDSDERCDLEAGMAKLLATRAAWEAADANVQIHGGNGYAEEYTASRLLVDARVLSIFRRRQRDSSARGCTAFARILNVPCSSELS